MSDQEIQQLENQFPAVSDKSELAGILRPLDAPIVKAARAVESLKSLLIALAFLAVAGMGTWLAVSTYRQVFGGRTRWSHALAHTWFASQFKAGDTDAPLLAMDWFSDHGVYFCRVTQTGRVFSARDVGHAIQGGGEISSSISFGSTNRALLDAAMNALPASSDKRLRKERQLLVSGVRSNQWFARTYDRANIPVEVERLYELTGAYLGWFIPVVSGKHLAHSEFGTYYTSAAGITSFSCAREAPVAVSAGLNGIQVWDVERGTVQDVLSLKAFPTYATEYWTATVSPDGGTLVAASNCAVHGVDLRTRKPLWSHGPLEQEGYDGKHLVIGGESGQFLFAAGAHTLERWDLASGQKLAVLASNQPPIVRLEVSRDGRVVLVRFQAHREDDSSASYSAVWEADKDEPACRFEEVGTGISADGRLIVFSPFGRRVLALFDWRAGQRHEVPLRLPYASHGTHSTYWSPDGKRLAAYVDSYPASIVVYETTAWKPLAQWRCGETGADSEVGFDSRGNLLYLRDHDLSMLDVARLKSVSD